MWNSEDSTYETMPNLIAKGIKINGYLVFHLIYPAEGYKLHVPAGDIKDANGNVIEPYYSNGGALAYGNIYGTDSWNESLNQLYDFENNPLGFEAVPIEPESTET